MARVQGPLHSDSASGTFAGTLTFASWKGRQYARERVTPSNPKSALQVGVRAMLGWLASAWADVLELADRASWEAEAAAAQISAFNAFVKSNMQRWANSLPFIAKSGDAESACDVTITTLTTTGANGYATISITPSGAGASGYVIYRDVAEITVPSRANAVAVVTADGANEVVYTDSPLVADTYHYRVGAFNDLGDLGTVKADQTAEVT